MTNKLAAKDRAQIFLAGAVIGFIVFVAIYGLRVVNFTNDTFLINGYIEKDIEQHYAGWMLYRSSPWQFPLGVGQNIAYPYGSSVSYTDSIPLFAIFFKIFRNLLPHTFQYFGLFVLLCFMLQGGFGGLLASLFTQSKVMCGLSSLIFVLSPVMIERAFRHCALTAHFIILAGLYYYFKNNGDTSKRALLPFFVLNALGITIHPYYLPFTFAIMFAFCLELFFRDKKYTLAVGGLLASMVVTLIVGWVIGAFYVGGSMASFGFGEFCMRYFAFFNPLSVGFSNWSKVFSPIPVMNEIEAFSYLGLGVLIAIPVAIIIVILIYKNSFTKTIQGFAVNNFGIIFSALAVAIFAMSNENTFKWLFNIPLAGKIAKHAFNIFRANGRFGWLVIYLIVLLVVWAFSKLTSEKTKAVYYVAILAICAIQIWDLGDVLASKHAYFTGSEGDMQSQVTKVPLANSFWDRVVEEYDCAYLLGSTYPNMGIEIATKFAKADKPTHTDFRARIDWKKSLPVTQGANEWILNGNLPDNSILFVSDISPDLADAIVNYGYDVYYVDFNSVICISKFSDEDINNFKSSGDFYILDYPFTRPGKTSE